MAIEVQRLVGVGLAMDMGRPGWARYGVPRGGWFDTVAGAAANQMVGNPPSAAGIEWSLAAVRLRCRTACCLAFSGAATTVLAAERVLTVPCSVVLNAGDPVELMAPTEGARVAMAVPGGFHFNATLGSVSGEPVGHVLLFDLTDFVPRHDSQSTEHDDTIDFVPLGAMGALSGKVSALMDRRGVRVELDEPLAEVPTPFSRPMAPGFIQVPDSKTIIVHGPDGPTVGGYGLIGAVTTNGLCQVGQWRPGQKVSLNPIEVRRSEG